LDSSTVRELVDAGIHFGHRAGRWNPKMKPYVFCSRNSIHIVNIKETIKGLVRGRKFLAHVVGGGKDVLFVGTKRQARQAITTQAIRTGMPFVCERWLGGTLTNFRTIRSRLGRLEELEQMEEQGAMAAQSKKMEATLRREMRKIRRNLDGIRTMERLPAALVIIDARREHLAVAEAQKLNIPTVCLIDTDSAPDLVNVPIPGNDDAMRAIEIILAELADAVAEGKARAVESQQASEQAQREKEKRPRSKRVSTTRAAEAVVAGEHAASEPGDEAAADTPIAPGEPQGGSHTPTVEQ